MKKATVYRPTQILCFKGEKGKIDRKPPELDFELVRES